MSATSPGNRPLRLVQLTANGPHQWLMPDARSEQNALVGQIATLGQPGNGWHPAWLPVWQSRLEQREFLPSTSSPRAL